MIGVGLVGLGWHGSRYASHLAKGDVAGMKLVAVSRRDRAQGEAQAREYGCRFHESVSALVDDSAVDVIIIVSPGGAHAEHVRVAMRAKKPALVEKPLTHSVDDARALVREARESQARVMVAHTLRWEPIYAEAAKFARKFENIRVAMALFHRKELANRVSADFVEHGRHRALFACGIHHLDWASLIYPEGFVSAIALEDPPTNGLSCNVSLRTKSDASFVLEVDLRATKSQETLNVFVEKDRFIFGDREGHRLALMGGAKLLGDEIPLPAWGPTLPRVLADFRDFIDGKIPNPVPLEAGARAVVLADACERSIKTNAPVAIPEELS